MKIEAERTEEERLHPHHWGYYDDEIHKGSLSNLSNVSSKIGEKPSVDTSSSRTFPQLDKKESSEIALLTNDALNKPSNQNSPFSQEQNSSVIFTILNAKNFLSTLAGPFTLFIPTDDALQNLPYETLQDLLLPENQEKLSTLVSKHVVAQEILKNNFQDKKKDFKTIGGHNLNLDNKDGKLTVDGAQVLRNEAAGNDGVIYIIDRVLL
jgi:uncharacterized surface protein with fasciclin (FAS1) repeats